MPNNSLALRSLGCLTVVSAALLVTAPAGAQDTGFSAQRYTPATAPTRDFFNVFGGDVGTHLDWQAALQLHYGAGLVGETDADGNLYSKPVSGVLGADVLANIALVDRLDIGVGIPLVLMQSADVADDAAIADPEAGFGLGDIRIVPRVLLFGTGGEESTRFFLSLALPVSLPTGDRASFQGSGFSTAPVVAAEVETAGGFAAALNVGYAYRSAAAITGTTADGTERTLLEVAGGIPLGVALSVPAGDVFAVAAEVNGEIGLGEGDDTPFEALVGGEVHLNNGLLVNFGFGRGLTGGWGAPAWRAIVGAGFAMDHNPDRDGDGLLNGADQCAEAAEDFDSFEDDDGCPEEDNDQDGVLDTRDRCRNNAEDVDGFDDDDGCPDTDNDGDLILDDADACRDTAEDLDGFDDQDGCPDGDNDGDGVADESDRCLAEAEDMDGFEDGDGCPEADNDQDGVLDGTDQCADSRESINGLDDLDGCADEAPIEIRAADNSIAQLVPIEFAGTSDDLSTSATGTVDALARALQTYPELRVRIVVFSYDRGDEEARIEISQRRADAIVEALVERGLVAETIQTSAYAIAEGSANTDTRVEIRIVR